VGSEAGSPDDLAWLGRLIERSPLLPDVTLRGHWCALLPWIGSAERYELAAALRAAEIAADRLEAGEQERAWLTAPRSEVAGEG
jgi:hypothetical protein